MNLDKLLSQEPFGKWAQKFLREYAANCPGILIQPIGTAGFRTDAEITEMFMSLMLKDCPEGRLAQDDLLSLFYAWYEFNSTYHNNYAPPKMALMHQLQKRYSLVKHAGQWCFKGVVLTVTTLEEATELIEKNRNNLEFKLPNFQAENTPEEERRRQEFDGLERLMIARDAREDGV